MTDGARSRTHPRAILSRLVFVLAAGLFAFVAWRTFGPGAAHGEWRSVSRQIQLDDLRVTGPSARGGHLHHPALIYFHDPGCRPCRTASERFRARLDRAGDDEPCGGAMACYVIGKPGAFVPDSAVTDYLGTVEVLVPQGPNPSLGFVGDLPMFAATDAAGRVTRAYVGIPDDDVFDRLLPRQPGVER